MVTEAYARNPAIVDILEPFLIIRVIGSMEIQYILSNEDKIFYTLIDHDIYKLSFQ
ncbi:hypothetical protein D3C73_1375500 [compost metagenome]